MWTMVNACGRVDGGAEGTRTPDPLIANEVLSQLSYSPVPAGRGQCSEAMGEVKQAPFVQVADRISHR